MNDSQALRCELTPFYAVLEGSAVGIVVGLIANAIFGNLLA